MRVHHYQACQILTVDRDAQVQEVLGYGEAGGTSLLLFPVAWLPGPGRSERLLLLPLPAPAGGVGGSDPV